MPGATLVSDQAHPAKMKVNVATGVGTSLLKIAKALNLHPKDLPDTDLSEDFTIPLASTSGALQFAYQLEKERVFTITFNGYPNAAGKLFVVGDTSVVDPA